MYVSMHALDDPHLLLWCCMLLPMEQGNFVLWALCGMQIVLKLVGGFRCVSSAQYKWLCARASELNVERRH